MIFGVSEVFHPGSAIDRALGVAQDPKPWFQDSAVSMEDHWYVAYGLQLCGDCAGCLIYHIFYPDCCVSKTTLTHIVGSIW